MVQANLKTNFHFMMLLQIQLITAVSGSEIHIPNSDPNPGWSF